MHAVRSLLNLAAIRMALGLALTALWAASASAQLGGGGGGGIGGGGGGIGGGGGGVGGGGGNTQIGGFQFNNVGGVYVDAAGMVANTETDDVGKLKKLRQQVLAEAPSDLAHPSQLRKVSLSQLEAAIMHELAGGRAVPDAMVYLAGLTRIQYVLVDPEAHDIILAGPAAGWRVAADGSVVSAENGMPVMLLEDLLVALRSAHEASRMPISCSIDPTPDGLTRLDRFFQAQQQMSPQVMRGVEEALGPQKITITGVPATSRLARVLVAADYRMKRLAMGFERSPVAGLPSFLNLLKAGGKIPTSMMPRWWLAANYQPVLADPEGLAFELRGASVVCLTEDEFVAANGQRQGTGQANPVAQDWANRMNERYEALAAALPVFGELQNVMDLLLVSALIAQEDLRARSGASLEMLGDAARITTTEVAVPAQVPTQASFVKRGRDYIISASGGVEINSWQLAARRETSAAVAEERASLGTRPANRWWWD